MAAIEPYILFVCLGAVVGFMAGLLGIGGGGIMVPMLTSIFLMQGISVDKVVHLALGTSMASIVMTSVASLRAHHAKNAVLWPIVKQMAPGIVLGTLLATFVASHLKGSVLAMIFAVFMAYVSLQMFINKKPRPTRQRPGAATLFGVGSGIGAISALVSIGGGSLTVPYLTWHNIDIKKAIGTSAAVGFPISVAGTVGYVINGWQQAPEQNLTYGFIYLPAVVLISLLSFITAPLGARLSHRLPVQILKKVFALLLIVLSIKMLFSVL